eukprot:18503-Heterococcus_DN1.PRE.2
MRSASASLRAAAQLLEAANCRNHKAAARAQSSLPSSCRRTLQSAAVVASHRIAPSSVSSDNFSYKRRLSSAATATTTAASSTTAPPAASTFYRRPLPSSCIAFSSTQGRELFKQAMLQGYLEAYWSLAEQYHTQDEPAYCGLSTLSMVLNALEIDPGRLWKGNWRWYSESVLESCEPLEVIKDRGISYRKLACLARCNGAACSVRDGATVSLDEFRRIVKHITGGGHGKCHLVIAYDRKVLGQTGGGHFSPIGAYNSEHDKVLIMDVARFKYSAHWVSLDTVWHAMQAIEQATGKARGMMVIYRQDRKGLLFTVCREAFQQWPQSAQWWRECIDKVSSAVTSAAVTAASVTTAEPLQSTQLQQQLDSQLNAFVKQFLTALPQQALQLVAAHKTHTHTAATTTASNTADTAKEVQQLELEQPPAIPRAQSCMKITPDRLMIALESSAVFKT